MAAALRFTAPEAVELEKRRPSAEAISQDQDHSWRIDSEGKTTHIGDAVAAKLDRSASDLRGESIHDFLGDDDSKKLNEAIRRSISEGSRYEFEVKRPKGKKFYANVVDRRTKRPTRSLIGYVANRTDKESQIIASIELENDIGDAPSSQSRTQEAVVRLQFEKELLEIVMEGTPTQIAYLDRDLRFVTVNSAYEKGSGHQRVELIGKGYFEVFPDDEDENLFNKVRATGKSVENKAKPLEYGDQTRRGQTFWDWSLVPVKDDRDVVQGLVLSLTEVTEQVESRRSIEHLAADAMAERQRLRTILDTIPVGVMVADQTGTVLESNKMLEKIWHGPLQVSTTADLNRLRGWWADNGIPLKPSDWNIASVLTGNKPELGQMIDILRFDGSRGTILSSAAPIRDAKGRMIGGITVVQDITHQRSLEHEALESKAKAELYLDLMNKDLSGLHSAVMESLAVVSKKANLDPKVKDHISTSIEHMEEASKLIDIVDKIKMIEGHELKYGLVDVGGILSEVSEHYKKLYKSKVKIIFTPTTGLTSNANSLLAEAFSYLIDDCISRMDKNLALKIEIAEAYEGGKQYHKIVFEDNVKEAQNKMKTNTFNLPLRGKNHSTIDDLRLYLIRTIVENNQGRIWLESNVSGDWRKGRKFVVMLPSVPVRQESLISDFGFSEEDQD
jgi:PAS domain S-box-containing protein